jgi:hypothetical protein
MWSGVGWLPQTVHNMTPLQKKVPFLTWGSPCGQGQARCHVDTKQELVDSSHSPGILNRNVTNSIIYADFNYLCHYFTERRNQL